MTKQIPTPTPPPSSGNRRVWLFYFLVFAAVLIILQTFGIFKTFERAQTTGWVDVKSPEYQNRPMPQRRPEKPSPQVEATLQEIAAEFEGPVFSNISTANSEKGWGLTDDEARYYDAMRERYGQSGSGNNWLGLVKRSYGTYKTVKEAFGGSADVTAVVRDAQKAMQIYRFFQEQFGVSPADAAAFAQSGQARSLSDWATFIESKRR